MKTPDHRAPSLRSAIKSLLILALICAPVFAATAPDSIAGKVYRETGIVLAGRNSWETTILYGTDGRFSILVSARGNATPRSDSYQVRLEESTRSDGGFLYTRTDDTTATITHTFYSGQAPETIVLRFTAPYGGVLGTSDFPVASFTLSDLSALSLAPTINLSVRGLVSAGHPLIAGFVVPGKKPAFGRPAMPDRAVPPAPPVREVLIRVVGPSLRPFGVTDPWSDPSFKLYREGVPADLNEIIQDDWSALNSFPGTPQDVKWPPLQAAFRKIFNSPYVAAFPLITDSKDAAAVVRLTPGDYTIVCTTAAGDVGGDALIEVYFLP